jgi:hypothetical protein
MKNARETPVAGGEAESPDEPKYTYAQVEAALADHHEIDGRSVGAFRGRIKNFQRLGIVPSSPGKGKKITYDFAAVVKWGLCLELAEFGIAPEYIKLIVEARGDATLATLKLPGEHVLYFSPFLLGGPRDLEAIRASTGIAESSKLTGLMTSRLPRVLIINLTELLRGLLSALPYDTRLHKYMEADDREDAGR